MNDGKYTIIDGFERIPREGEESKASQVDIQLHRAEASATALEKTINTLRERLKTVLRAVPQLDPGVPTKEEEQAKLSARVPESLVPLAARIKNISESVQLQVKRIEDCLERLEL